MNIKRPYKIRNTVDEMRAARETVQAPIRDRYGNVTIETSNAIYTNNEDEYRRLEKEYYRNQYMKENYNF